MKNQTSKTRRNPTLKNQISKSCRNPNYEKPDIQVLLESNYEKSSMTKFKQFFLYPFESIPMNTVIRSLIPYVQVLMKKPTIEIRSERKPKSNFIPEKPPSIEQKLTPSDEVMSVASFNAGYRLR